MASGVTDPKVIAQCIKDGAKDYINKPFRFEQVLQSVNGALDKRRVELEIQRYFQDMGKKAQKEPVEPRKLFLGAMETLVNTLESSDKYTQEHSHHVTDLSMAIGRQLGLSPEECKKVFFPQSFDR